MRPTFTKARTTAPAAAGLRALSAPPLTSLFACGAIVLAWPSHAAAQPTPGATAPSGPGPSSSGSGAAPGPAPTPSRALSTGAPPTGAGAGSATDNTVEVHEFDPVTGQDAAMARRTTAVTYLNPGALITFAGGRQHATGWGLEASAMRYPTGTWAAFGYGAFAQGQLYDGKHPRVALGGQACVANVGLELGLAFRGGDDDFAGTASVHGAIFLSIAFLTLALRDTLPLNGYGDGRTDKMGFGSEVAFSLGVKLPILIEGRDPRGFSIFGGP